jgi:hypothetical protein
VQAVRLCSALLDTVLRTDADDEGDAPLLLVTEPAFDALADTRAD